MHNKAVCQISANLTNLFCQISNYLSYFWQTVRFCFYENPSVRSKEQFICVMKQQRDRNSNCQTGHCWTRRICSTSNFLHTECPKKMILVCQSLKSHWIHALTRGARANNPSVKNIRKHPVWNNYDKDKCFSCPVDFISISFTSFEDKNRSSKLV